MLTHAPATARFRPAPLLRGPVAMPPTVAASLRDDASKGACACGGGCPRCAGAAVQAKLLVGDVADPAEREADALADQALGLPAEMENTRTSAGATIVRRVGRGSDGSRGGGIALSPGAAAGIAAAMRGGEPLPAHARAAMEPRFGADFSEVRIHRGSEAAASAAAIGARAYTLGRDVVFGAGQYDLAGDDGRRLLAHELAHTLQQGESTLRRTPCRSAAQCAAPAAGDTAAFVTGITPVQSANTAAITAAPPASPLAAQLALIGAPTPNIASLMTANGMALLSEVFGIFQSPRIEGNAGAQTNTCNVFPNESPAGAAIRADPAAVGKACIEVPPSLETEAGTLLSATPPLSQPQRAQRTRVLAVIAHEMEHAHFNLTQAATITPTADCTINTVVRTNPDPAFDDFRVGFFLSEIAAISNQFPSYFDNFIANDNPVDHRLLFDEERNEAFNPSEGIVGVITGLQCVCSCASVNSLVTQTINLATASWTPRQRLAFLRAMTRIMPSFWPPALVTPDGPE